MQPNRIVYPQGRVTVTLLANEYLAIYTQGTAHVFQNLGFPNEPAKASELASSPVINTETVFGPYASGGTFDILAGAAQVAYAQGIATPRVLSQAQAQTQGTPGVLNATGTLTGAMMLAGIVTSSTAAAVAGTMDTGAILDTIVPDMQIGQSFDFSIVNTGGNTFTLTASSGVTIVGVATILTASSGQFRLRKTAAATYVAYRLTGN